MCIYHLVAFLRLYPVETPKVLVAIKTLECFVGETAEFYCKARGQPKPRLLWYKDDKLVPEDYDRYKIVTHTTTAGFSNSSLTIVDLTTLDDGTFVCEAVNVAGKDQCKAELFVDG